MTLDKEDAKLAADTLRMLAVDAVEKAKSGHPGMPMGMADIAFCLWHDHLRFNPDQPDWPNRDRFILSAGHGSMLLYGLLHLFGFGITLEELKNFRQWDSRTPGHPEFGVTPGVEVTTGPLGQGFANAVGLALASKMAAARFNDPQFKLIDHHVYVIAGDGDMMEGITAEAASLAGHLRLGNLICIYDDNGITIEGATSLAFSEDVEKRFRAYGWDVMSIDGHDLEYISNALAEAKAAISRPTLIIAKTHIGHGSPGKQDSAEAHGSPLGEKEALATRKNLNWPEETFYIPGRVREICAARVSNVRTQYLEWEENYRQWCQRDEEKALLWQSMWSKSMPPELCGSLLEAVANTEGATRALSGKIIQTAAAMIPSLVGGSADLEPSTNTWIHGSSAITSDSYCGRNIHFGIREHAMAGMMNGIARYGCFIPFGSTFLMFSDYCRPSIRLAALMQQQVIFVFTHDSVFVGEDGPTHQPVEQLSTLRLIPDLAVIRPADAVETAMAWFTALERKNGPTALILTRQSLPKIDRSACPDHSLIRHGAYIVTSGGDSPDVVLMASGSEVSLVVAAAQVLQHKGVVARVVSVPWLESFLEQPKGFRLQVLPEGVPRCAVEAGRGGLWAQLLGENGLFIGVESFGASAPASVIAAKLGFTAEAVAERVLAYLHQ